MTKTEEKKIGRPPLPPEKKRTRWIQIRVSEEEHAQAEAEAKARKISVGELGRRLFRLGR